jgi:hypothetical protein
MHPVSQEKHHQKYSKQKTPKEKKKATAKNSSTIELPTARLPCGRHVVYLKLERLEKQKTKVASLKCKAKNQ